MSRDQTPRRPIAYTNVTLEDYVMAETETKTADTKTADTKAAKQVDPLSGATTLEGEPILTDEDGDGLRNEGWTSPTHPGEPEAAPQAKAK